MIKLFFNNLLLVFISVVKVVTLLIIYMLDFVFLFKVKNRNKEVIDLISGVNETRLLVQHESCECNGRLNKSVCNSKQK